jgi:hypothetical protein
VKRETSAPRGEPRIKRAANADSRPTVKGAANADSRPTVKKLLRLGGYTAAALGIIGGLALRSAYGNMMESALEIGSELGKIGGTGSERPIRLNGEAIYVSSTVQEVPLEGLLDRVEARCKDSPEDMLDALSNHAPSAERKEHEERLSSREAAGVVRYDTGEKGVVVCFMRPEGAPSGITARLSRISRFLDTGDLGHLGDVRYVFAERNAEGRTHVVTAWTDGSFNLYSLFPAGGDAPGSDLEDVPRPRRSVRLLTAGADGVPYSARIYDAPGRPKAILAHYDLKMIARGWKPIVIDDKDHRRVYGQGERHVYVLPKEDRGRTLVTLLEMSGRR